MPAPPDAGLVASLGRAVEPLVHAPEAVQSARISGVDVVDAAVLAHEGAYARPLARVGGDVGSGAGCDRGDGPFALLGEGVADPAFRQRRLAPIIVFDARALLLRGK